MSDKIKKNNEAMWLDRVQAYRASGLSINHWCKENAVKSSSFHYWLKKFSEHDEQHVTQWGEIKMTQTITVSPSKPIRLYLNDVTVDIPVDFDASSLAEVLSAIRSSC